MGSIITRRTITITASIGMSGTATATGKILILYGCFIPLLLSNQVWWVGGGIKGHISASTINATIGLGGGGKFIEELGRAANGY